MNHEQFLESTINPKKPDAPCFIVQWADGLVIDGEPFHPTKTHFASLDACSEFLSDQGIEVEYVAQMSINGCAHLEADGVIIADVVCEIDDVGDAWLDD